MRINKIKISGFKSFVDPTHVELPGNLTGVVGPNGCGKSNIIDAVLWVLGENSAKHLRGDSMADVIFNGSNTRKPVGQASVEIIFDNGDGKIGGQYASYNEISIKRQVGRDGISTYYLNGGRCRRRDITHIFLGTGIGSRTYSVIEQGMISRVIEAKPEELRMFLEEAAGISKYKERRRETESRIRNSQDNISRIRDIIAELDKQLQHLQRQAKAAEKYQQLKREERQAQAQLLALRWRAAKVLADAQQQFTGQHANAVEATTAALRTTESEMASAREVQIAATDRFNEIQSACYSAGAELSRAEQTIQHTHERRQAVQRELAQTENNLGEARQHIASDEQRLAALAGELATLEPQQASQQQSEQQAAGRAGEAEQALHDWQVRWDEFNRTAAEIVRTENVEQTRLEHLEEGLAHARERVRALAEEHSALTPQTISQAIAQLRDRVTGAAGRHEQLTGRHEATETAIGAAREDIHRIGTQLDEYRQRRQVTRGRIASLEALQQSALGTDRPAVVDWLRRFELADAQRLADVITVESGWERAVEATIRIPLESLCVDNLDRVIAGLSELSEGAASALLTGRMTPGNLEPANPAVPTLASRAQAPWPIADLFAGVYAVETLDEARRLEPQLRANESVITRDGTWFGRGWLVASRENAGGAGLLARTQELKTLTAQAAELDVRIDELAQRLEDSRRRLAQLEHDNAATRAQLNASHESVSAIKSDLAAHEVRLEQVTNRLARVVAELGELDDQNSLDEGQLHDTRERLQAIRLRRDGIDRQRQALIGERDVLRNAAQQAREGWRMARDDSHSLALKCGALSSERAALEQALARNRALMQRLNRRGEELDANLSAMGEPLARLQTERESLLARRLAVEGELTVARGELQAAEGSLRALEQQRLAVERELSGRRDELESARIELRAMEVRLQNLREQIEGAGCPLQETLDSLPAQATEAQWEERLADLDRRIQRLGAINLAAIDEFTTLSERKTYLDRQHADLTEALATLEEAIRKIDRETRTRFKETFDRVNTGLQNLFPVLFGGGHAYLELAGEDLLETGVTVMARPPGKRNSTIHLLSGGEKALTAVALVFAIFELNPAPFCLLDEVDAPLDDANVVRLSQMLKEKSGSIQFLFITHNKITMEIAGQLIGVTMQEAGVSRLVAVNMEEAVRLAATA